MDTMLFKGNSSKLELLIEKIQANKETLAGIDFIHNFVPASSSMSVS